MLFTLSGSCMLLYMHLANLVSVIIHLYDLHGKEAGISRAPPAHSIRIQAALPSLPDV